MTELNNKVELEIDKIGEESLISAERHFASETPWVTLNYALGVPSTLLAAGAGFTAIFSSATNTSATYVTGFISFTVAILTGISTYFDPIKKANDHTSAAKSYQSLYNETRLFKVDLNGKSEQEIKMQLKIFMDKLNQLNDKSPSIPRRSYRIASQRLKNGEGKVFQHKLAE